ncbi:MAG: tetratricopeptide repeat protein [Armatimonadota bacterium]
MSDTRQMMRGGTPGSIAALVLASCLGIGVCLAAEEPSVEWLLEAIPPRALTANMEKERGWLKEYLRQLRPDYEYQRHYMLQYIQHYAYEAALVTGSALLKKLDKDISTSERATRTASVSWFCNVGTLMVKALEHLRDYESAQAFAHRLCRYVSAKYETLPSMILRALMVSVRAALYEGDFETAAQRCRDAARQHASWRGADDRYHPYALATLHAKSGHFFRLAGRPAEAIRAYEEARRVVTENPDAARKLREAGRLPPKLVERYEQIGTTLASEWMADCRERLGNPEGARVVLRQHVDDAVERSRFLLEDEHRVVAPARALEELERALRWLLGQDALLDQLPAAERERYAKTRDEELPRAIFETRDKLCARLIMRARVYEWTERWTEAAAALENLERHQASLLADRHITEQQQSSWEWSQYLDLPLRLARAYNALERPADAAKAVERARDYWRTHPDRIARRPRQTQHLLESLVKDGTIPERYANPP